VVRGHRGAASAVAGALAAAGVTLRVYGGRHLLLVLGAGARAGRWRLLTRSPAVLPAGLWALVRLRLPGPRPGTEQLLRPVFFGENGQPERQYQIDSVGEPGHLDDVPVEASPIVERPASAPKAIRPCGWWWTTRWRRCW
jgi:hypothetical protein